MNTVLSSIQISSVNMEDRKNLGLKAGDTVRVHQKIEDKGKTRIQIFEGLVLARKHGSEPGATFTVRKVVDGIGVEKVFPLFSPLIDKIEIVRRSTVRRAKLYYIREKVAREIRRQMRRMHLMGVASESEIEMKVKREQDAADEAVAKEAEEAKAAEEVATKAPEMNAVDETVKIAEETPEVEVKEELASQETLVEVTEEKKD
jgi:large subunit ribosomal protein L19